MNKIFFLILLTGMIMCFNPAGLEGKAFQNPADKVHITILYDNYTFTEGTQSDWGFSCLITGTEKTILFDTGTRSDILKHNIKTLGVDISRVDAIVISHNHGDHTGGLAWVLDRVSPKVPVCAPSSYHGTQVTNNKERVIHAKDSVEICRGVYTTGEMGESIIEQALILEAKNGLVLITGCAHPGIVKIIEKAESVLNKNVYFALGGFHLMSKPENQVRRIIERFRELGVTRCGATHCTGPEAISLFQDSYGDKFVDMGVGRTIKIDTAGLPPVWPLSFRSLQHIWDRPRSGMPLSRPRFAAVKKGSSLRPIPRTAVRIFIERTMSDYFQSNIPGNFRTN